ncbi:tRNA-binding protein [Marilutibacter maris]|uniref:tRNA-binding protein n=1 Tax=Marilutibacter maris TaxID=1605891 RepID=A0A2U9T7F5_9GAMM|nr:tRNA-binding protein [Lysobacter maris]AWV07325.1 tRNA-binding protein [Lysobacter maris]KAB8192476.1 tRNA-binding protein [Lysobacter maris]
MSETDQAWPTIAWSDFEKLALCAGTVLRVEEFPEARKPAWKLWVDFGPHGVRKTSAQIRDLYRPEDLVGRQIVGVLNFPPRQVGKFMSEFLLTGFPTDDGVVITTVEREVPDGTRLA